MLRKELEDVNNRIDNLDSEYEEHKQKLLERKEVLDDVIAGWKTEHQPTNFYRHNNYVSLEVKVDDEHEAMEFMATMNPESMFYLMDGWTRFTPEHQLEDKYPMKTFSEVISSRYGYCSMHPYYFEIRNNPVQRGEHSLIFWCTLNNRHVEIRVVIKNPDRGIRGVNWDYRPFSGGYANQNVRTFDNSGVYNYHYSPARGTDEAEPDGRFCYVPKGM